MEYRGRLNTVADALSRRDSDDSLVTVCAISSPQFALFNDLRNEIATSTELSDLHARILSGELDDPWSCCDDLILHGRHVYVLPSSPLVASLLEQPRAPHEGIQKTLYRLRETFHIPVDRALVQESARSCQICQRTETETLHPASLLQPLIVPASVWSDIY